MTATKKCSENEFVLLHHHRKSDAKKCHFSSQSQSQSHYITSTKKKCDCDEKCREKVNQKILILCHEFVTLLLIAADVISKTVAYFKNVVQKSGTFYVIYPKKVKRKKCHFWKFFRHSLTFRDAFLNFNVITQSESVAKKVSLFFAVAVALFVVDVIELQISENFLKK